MLPDCNRQRHLPSYLPGLGRAQHSGLSSVLDALEHHLMDEAAVRIFCEDYAAERNRLSAKAEAGRAGLEKELRQVTADHGKPVDAIIAGVPPSGSRTG